MSVELRHLRYFAAVVEEMHFGRAAELLHISQPSLSQQIRRLEEIVGVELIDRSNRAIALTPAGEALAGHAHRAFQDVDAAVVAAREAAAGKIGRLSIGFVETAAIAIVPGAVRRFRETHPRVSLELRELPIRAQTERLIGGSLDLGFVRAAPDHSELVVERVLEEEFIAAVPVGHRFAAAEKLTPAEVIAEPLVVIEREVIPGLHDETMAIARAEALTVNIVQRATSVLSILGLVSAGLGLALLPASVRDLAVDHVCYIELDPAPGTSILAVRHRDNRSPQVEPFLESGVGGLRPASIRTPPLPGK